MAEASLIPIAKSLLETVAPYALDTIKLWWGARDDLQKLVSTIEFIKAGLLDAERRQNESECIKLWIRRLRNVLYDADDFFDMVATIEKSKQTFTGKERFVGELRQFFSKDNHVVLQAQIAQKIKKIRQELDGIKSDMENFAFDCTLVESSMCYERESTGPVIAANEIIGREDEEKELMGLLLDGASKEEGYADVIAIVGFGGLGKTTLAQLLYNNEAVQENFEHRAWACISDTKGETSKARIILGALQTAGIVGSAMRSSNRINVQEIAVDELQQEIQERVQGKKYLLVVDDYWDEDRNTWLYLMSLLRGGKAGSKIVVTTRSTKVALAVGVDSPHRLKGLADDKAWELFKRLAFRCVADSENQRLMMMGKKIVKKCKNVPLAIKAIASLLYTCCDGEKEWGLIADSNMLTLEQYHGNLKILPVLKLSYDHLPSHLKHCFAFCSIFPKDSIIDGEKLIFYWISQGYVRQRSGRGQPGLMQIGETCLKELTSRFFLEKDDFDEDERYGTYKMHDLMHDLAQEVAGEEVLRVESSENWPDSVESHDMTKRSNHVSMDVRIRHLGVFEQNYDYDSLPLNRANYLRSVISSSEVSRKAFEVLCNLRLLDMKCSSIETLSKSLYSSIAELKHLRCLIISDSQLTQLPEAICMLHNLKVLNVSGCTQLESLPRNLNRLMNLTCLSVGGCTRLRGLPCTFGALSSLESMGCFIIGGNCSEYCGLEALVELVNFRDEALAVCFRKKGGGVARKEDDKKRVDLSSLVHLDWLSFQWLDRGGGEDSDDNDDGDGDGDDGVWEREGIEFQCSQLPSNLKELKILDFPGHTFPEWKTFNNLSDIFLHCCKCRYLPSFGKQPRIKRIQLWRLDALEYIQMEENDDFGDENQYFPCLESLQLANLSELKAWSPAMEKLGHQHMSSSLSDAAAAFPRFHSLTHLVIQSCPALMSMPLPPKGRLDGVQTALKEPLKTLLKENEQGRAAALVLVREGDAKLHQDGKGDARLPFQSSSRYEQTREWKVMPGPGKVRLFDFAVLDPTPHPKQIHGVIVKSQLEIFYVFNKTALDPFMISNVF